MTLKKFIALNRYKNYFKKNKSIGSKDRKEISENLYKLIRWKSLIDFLCITPVTWKKRIEKLNNFDFKKYFSDESIPIHIRLSFPKIYFEKVKKSYNQKKAIDFCLTSNEIDPTTIRCNPIKITRDFLFDQLKQKYDIKKCKKSSLGIIFKKINFFETKEFKKGLFEIQDEASQSCKSNKYKIQRSYFGLLCRIRWLKL